MPTYGIGGEGFERGDIRAHGRDERVRVDWFYKAVDFYYPFLKAVTSE
jgi:acetylornithine deacetylase/succinyl-diaminopimelate desuccinylase-like protein